MAGLTLQRDGSGLGLALGRRLAKAMGGDPTAKSASNAGSVFTLTIVAPAGTSGV